MAGIGFELRRILRRDNYASTLKAYVYAGLISSGPWVMSIIAVMLIGIFSAAVLEDQALVLQFLVSVTWMMAGSLILTGGVQLYFTRFVADRLYEKKISLVLPNLGGVLSIVTLVSGAVASLLLWLLFEASALTRVLLLTNFVTLCNLWLVIVFLSGMKAYNRILLVMLGGYCLMMGSAWFLRWYGLEGLLAALLVGHASLLFIFLADILREYPTSSLVRFDFLQSKQGKISLLFSGLAYNMAVWADKFIFWLTPSTSQPVLEPLRMSLLYDLPIFLAYLAVIPGMAVFLVRIETDFAESYDQLYNAIRNGENLEHIYYLKDQMLLAVRQGVFEIFKIQGITVTLLFLWAGDILDLIGISRHYLPLFYVDLIGVSLQVLFMALLNVFFYLDKRRAALRHTGIFLLLNLLLTGLSIQLGPSFYGYGFTCSLLICGLLALAELSRVLDDLEYETFMLGR